MVYKKKEIVISYRAIITLFLFLVVMAPAYAIDASPGDVTDLRAQACTAENNRNSANTYNAACDGTYPAACGAGNDLVSCNDGNVETQTFGRNKFAGVHIQTSNTSVTDCDSIDSVQLCYEWWVTGGTLTNCLIAVDADGNASYSTVNSTCPGSSTNPGVVCSDVTSLESWTCNSFFGTSGTKAVARDEVSRSSGGGASTLSTDVLFFNVSYSVAAGDNPPDVNLINPANGVSNLSNNHMFFSNATDDVNLTNATLFHNIGGSWVANQTVMVNVTSNTSNFSVKNILPGTYDWNVEWCDSGNNCNQADSNFTFTVEEPNTPPTANLINPSNGTSNSSNNHVFFGNATDDFGLVNATLFHNINCPLVANQTVTANGTFDTASFSLGNIVNGIHSWNILWCDIGNQCEFAPLNFIFEVV